MRHNTNINQTKFPADFAAISSEEICQIVSDVLVHQIELEIQNEQLRRTQQAQTATRAQYFDLYNLAPVGYCTFNELGEIVEANIAATELLNMARAELIGQPITRYIRFLKGCKSRRSSRRRIGNCWRRQSLKVIGSKH